MSRIRKLAVRDMEIEVEEAGEGERAFVLVHGLTGSRDDFREQMEPLSRLGRTLALDQRGHGGSTNSGRAELYTAANLVEDLCAAFDALGLARPDLLGHSLGGMVALSRGTRSRRSSRSSGPWSSDSARSAARPPCSSAPRTPPFSSRPT